MTDNPLISAVIPVYNGSNFLREAIESVLNQTYRNYELIVVDDGSTDDTWNIIQSYGNVIRAFHKENGGVSSALNLGIREMKGEWFAWLSHDDLWMPDKLELQMSYHNLHPHILGSYTHFVSINENKSESIPCYCPEISGSKGLRDLFMGNFIPGDTIFIHKKVFADVGLFDEKLRVSQDYDMWLRIIHKYKLGLIPKHLTSIRFHPNQDGKKFKHLEDGDLRQLIIKNFESIDKNKLFSDLRYKQQNELESYACFWFANKLCYLHQWYDIADEFFLKAYSINPTIVTKLMVQIKAKKWFTIRNIWNKYIKQKKNY